LETQKSNKTNAASDRNVALVRSFCGGGARSNRRMRSRLLKNPAVNNKKEDPLSRHEHQQLGSLAMPWGFLQKDQSITRKLVGLKALSNSAVSTPPCNNFFRYPNLNPS